MTHPISRLKLKSTAVHACRLVNSAAVEHLDALDKCALQITLMQGPAPFQFTSARIRAKATGPLGAIQPTPPVNGKPSVGVRVAARIMLPKGATQGIWPAFWMLPTYETVGFATVLLF